LAIAGDDESVATIVLDPRQSGWQIPAPQPAAEKTLRNPSPDPMATKPSPTAAPESMKSPV
jgi:hypothetical protein